MNPVGPNKNIPRGAETSNREGNNNADLASSNTSLPIDEPIDHELDTEAAINRSKKLRKWLLGSRLLALFLYGSASLAGLHESSKPKPEPAPPQTIQNKTTKPTDQENHETVEELSPREIEFNANKELEAGIIVKDSKSFAALLKVLKLVTWHQIDAAAIKFGSSFKLDPESKQTAELYKTIISRRIDAKEIDKSIELSKLTKDFDFASKFLKNNPQFFKTFPSNSGGAEIYTKVQKLFIESIRKAFRFNDVKKLESMCNTLAKNNPGLLQSRWFTHSMQSSIRDSMPWYRVDSKLENFVSLCNKINVIKTSIAPRFWDRDLLSFRFICMFTKKIETLIAQNDTKGLKKIFKGIEKLKLKNDGSFSKRYTSAIEFGLESATKKYSKSELKESFDLLTKFRHTKLDELILYLINSKTKVKEFLDLSTTPKNLKQNGNFIARAIEATNNKDKQTLKHVFDELIINNDLSQVTDCRNIANSIYKNHFNSLQELSCEQPKYKPVLQLLAIYYPQILTQYPEFLQDKEFIKEAITSNPSITKLIDKKLLRDLDFLSDTTEQYYRQKARHKPQDINEVYQHISKPKLQSRLKAKAFWEGFIVNNKKTKSLKAPRRYNAQNLNKAEILSIIKNSRLEDILEVHRETINDPKLNSQRLNGQEVFSADFLGELIDWEYAFRYDQQIIKALKSNPLRELLVLGPEKLESDLKAISRSNRYSQLNNKAFYKLCPYLFLYLKIFDSLEDLKSSSYKPIKGLSKELQSKLKKRFESNKKSIIQLIAEKPWDLYLLFGNRIKAFLDPDLFTTGPKQKAFDNKLKGILKNLYTIHIQKQKEDTLCLEEPLIKLIAVAGSALVPYLPPETSIESILKLKLLNNPKTSYTKYFQEKRLAALLLFSPDLIKYYPAKYQSKEGKLKLKNIASALTKDKNKFRELDLF